MRRLHDLNRNSSTYFLRARAVRIGLHAFALLYLFTKCQKGGVCSTRASEL